MQRDERARGPGEVAQDEEQLIRERCRCVSARQHADTQDTEAEPQEDAPRGKPALANGAQKHQENRDRGQQERRLARGDALLGPGKDAVASQKKQDSRDPGDFP